ncbi:MAG: hypothetical protein KF725_07530 [Cyclobacteriaceae bacterium]|nr:hypothetical protein [Cyclobacteriaceae bacterium]UYN88225.1 MAG: hypothetical protein KIT51_08275 [Cyclobacteriaceae bacterium]
MIKLLTYTHILAGIISLIVAPLAMLVRKGSKAHRLWGKIFFWCMTWICFSAIILSTVKWIPFLLLIAVFSYYSVYVGYRALYRKQIHQGKGVTWFDWMAGSLAGLFNLSFFVWGMHHVVTGQAAFGLLSAGFGSGGLIMVYNEAKSYIKPPDDKFSWFYRHIGSMLGGFIASVTAFSAQVMHFMPGVIQWLWPSLVGVPLIIYWVRTYRKKLATGMSFHEALS